MRYRIRCLLGLVRYLKSVWHLIKYLNYVLITYILCDSNALETYDFITLTKFKYNFF